MESIDEAVSVPVSEEGSNRQNSKNQSVRWGIARPPRRLRFGAFFWWFAVPQL
jgi:hypothetical protein